MKDVSLYEVVPTKFISLFLELYFIFYEFSKFLNELVQLKVAKLADSFLLPCPEALRPWAEHQH
jgi:hypothetical protein